MTVLTARIEAHATERRELAQALLAWATAAREETGARSCHLYEDVESPAVFYLVSRWESRQAFDAHVAGCKFGNILGALDLLALPHHVAVTEMADLDGSAALRALRRLRDQTR